MKVKSQKPTMKMKTAALEELLQEKQEQLQDMQNAQNEKLQSSVKSDIDKEDLYESPKEQMMDEIAMRSGVLDNIAEDIVRLKNIDKNAEHDSVVLGALIATNQGLFLVAVAHPERKHHGEEVFCISTASPLFKSLEGKKVGESAELNGTTYMIESIV